MELVVLLGGAWLLVAAGVGLVVGRFIHGADVVAAGADTAAHGRTHRDPAAPAAPARLDSDGPRPELADLAG